MPLARDLRTARRVLSGLWRARQARREVARLRSDGLLPTDTSTRIAVYFADGPVNLYQLRQWYAPLAELAKRHPVAIIARNPSTVLALLAESPVPVLYARQVVDLEKVIAAREIRIVFYVNQNTRNFQMMRYGRMWHVFINHGESDKMYMTTNQFKAYDYSFVAGQAALDRLSRKLWEYDTDKRAVPIGRPQADHLGGDVPFVPDDRVVVLYAPTWEGDRAAAAYGSIASHGVALTAALLASGRHRLIYRPHPRSGVTDPAYRAANETIIAAIATANAADPAAQHVVDREPALGWQLAVADVAISDISAMVYDRLATGKPLVVTRPVAASASIDTAGFLGDADWLSAADAAHVVGVVDSALVSDESRQKLDHWVQHHFGDTTPGAATARFHSAVDDLMAKWARHAASHPLDGLDEEDVSDDGADAADSADSED